MNNIVENSVLKYFEQISKIPRNTGNEKGMQDYLINFAVERNLPYYKDDFNNVIIFKKTCNCEPIILQAHTDMVCVKSSKTKHNFQTDPIQIIKKGNYLKAKGTSLGADDGIGVAIILDILDSDLPCNIEAVFTSSEETTMSGAYNIDVKKLKSKNMICLDGFESNTIITSSAGFVDFYVSFNNEKLFIDNDIKNKTYLISLSGLEGGHSGFDINKGRGSTHKLLAQLLLKIPDIMVNKFSGGHNYNVIPSHTECVFTTSLSEKDLKNIIKFFYIQNKKIYKNLKIKCSRLLNQNLILKNGVSLLKFINDFSQGVLSKDENNNIISSQNLSEISTDKGYILIGIRSNNKKQEELIVKNLQGLCQRYDMQGKVNSSQPAFNTQEDSNMLKNLIKFGDNPKQTKMHIAVESGIFQERIKKLDVVIISPTIKDAHSVNERVDIETITYTSNWLKKYLKNN